MLRWWPHIRQGCGPLRDLTPLRRGILSLGLTEEMELVTQKLSEGGLEFLRSLPCLHHPNSALLAQSPHLPHPLMGSGSPLFHLCLGWTPHSHQVAARTRGQVGVPGPAPPRRPGAGSRMPRPPRAPGRIPCRSAAARSRSSTRERGPGAGRPEGVASRPGAEGDPGLERGPWP
ncbi:unnamed protein product [Rangifer tarandus platyrhynchus]|uniref:Uncharacterized protein n=1 Tax=Rangifer tarandus platyrhynchus TaxID=3082113 RepID=A0AC59ZM41_RANTA